MPGFAGSLQDAFLNGLRKENISVVIYLIGGAQVRGNIQAFDNFTILLESSGKAQLVYKHAIAYVFPVKYPESLRLSARETKDRKERVQTQAHEKE